MDGEARSKQLEAGSEQTRSWEEGARSRERGDWELQPRSAAAIEVGRVRPSLLRKLSRAIGQDFLGGATGFVPSYRDSQQNIYDRRSFSRANSVAEWLVEPKKTFLGLYPNTTRDNFVTYLHGSSPRLTKYISNLGARAAVRGLFVIC